MYKKIISLSFITIFCLLIVSCGKKAAKDEVQTVTVVQESEITNNTDESETTDESYTMSIYTEAPNKNS